MAAKKHPKTCAYCGNVTTDWTDDHVIPDCLWDDRDLPVQMVTVRACSTCNNFWSIYEGDFRSVLAMMSNDQHELVQQIVGGVVQRHLKADAKFRQQIVGSLQLVPSFSRLGVFSGIRPTFRFEWKNWDAVIGKIVRGMFYHDLKTPMPREYVVQSWRGNGFWEDAAARHNIDEMAESWGNMGGNDDVFMGKRGYGVENGNRRIFLLLFYRSVAVFAWTTLATQAEFPDPSHPDQVALEIAARRLKRQQHQKR